MIHKKISSKYSSLLKQNLANIYKLLETSNSLQFFNLWRAYGSFLKLYSKTSTYNFPLKDISLGVFSMRLLIIFVRSSACHCIVLHTLYHYFYHKRKHISNNMLSFTIKSPFQEGSSTVTCTAALFTITERWKHATCPWTDERVNRRCSILIHTLQLLNLKSILWPMLQHDESWRHYAKWNNPVTRGHTLPDFSHMKYGGLSNT